MTKQHKPISIKDVAQASGVSVATVSRIINNTGRFSAATKAKVDAVINQLGYEKNKLAVSLRSNESHTVGILVPDITNVFFATVVKKCERLLFDRGYSSIICNTERSPQREHDYTQVLMEHRVDGLIIISSHQTGDTSVTNDSIPVVYIDRDPNSHHESIVSSAHYNGGKMATEFLLKQKLNPYLVMTKTESSATLDRVSGFKDVLKDHNYQDVDSRIFKLDLTSDQFLKAAPQLDQFVREISTTQNPGIFSINDNVAFMVIKAAQNLGLRVPEDLSVIGYDGTSYSQISSPQITTILQDSDKIAQSACDILVDQMTQQSDDEQMDAKVVSIPVTLIKRESTR